MSAVVDTPVVSRHGLPGLAAGPVVASAAAVLAVFVDFPLSGLSYPGFPIDAAAGAEQAATSIPRPSPLVLGCPALRRSGRRPAPSHRGAGAMVAVVLTGGVVARAGRRRPAAAGPVDRLAGARSSRRCRPWACRCSRQTSDAFAPYPGACPVRLGELGVSRVPVRSTAGTSSHRCREPSPTTSRDRLPAGGRPVPASTWWSTETMTPLGRPLVVLDLRLLTPGRSLRGSTGCRDRIPAARRLHDRRQVHPATASLIAVPRPPAGTAVMVASSPTGVPLAPRATSARC